MSDIGKSDIRKISNPSDKITINCDDMDAARLAVILLGQGWYGIAGENGMPILALGSPDKWAQSTYGKSLTEFINSVSEERLAAALESVTNVKERTSMNDIVAKAHRISEKLRRNLETQ